MKFFVLEEEIIPFVPGCHRFGYFVKRATRGCRMPRGQYGRRRFPGRQFSHERHGEPFFRIDLYEG